jgi:CheY-like chemotaxis protein
MKRILIADDDSVIRKLLRKILEDAGYQVTEAADGKIAIKLYHEEPPDVIILDLVMPEKEGIETIIELKRDFPNVKIITITGGIMGEAETLLIAARRLGARYAFKKPLNPGEILQAVQKLVNGGQ